MTTTYDIPLPIAELVVPKLEPTATLAERFQAFHEANPHVADALESLAAQWLARHERVGVKSLWERLRWEVGIQTDSTPRLNNNWPAFYARLLIDRHPEWADAIQTRRALADEVA